MQGVQLYIVHAYRASILHPTLVGWELMVLAQDFNRRRRRRRRGWGYPGEEFLSKSINLCESSIAKKKRERERREETWCARARSHSFNPRGTVEL